jgi:hypothetical protein
VCVDAQNIVQICALFDQPLPSEVTTALRVFDTLLIVVRDLRKITLSALDAWNPIYWRIH